MTRLTARVWDGDDVFKWVVVAEHVPSDFWAQSTIVREVMDWYFHFPRNVVKCEEQAE